MCMCNICNSVLVGSSQTSECTGQTLWQILWQTSGPHDQCESRLAGELNSAITAPNPPCTYVSSPSDSGHCGCLLRPLSCLLSIHPRWRRGEGDFMCLVAYCSYVTVHRKIWHNTGTYYWIFILFIYFLSLFIFFSFTHSTFRYKALQVL